MRVIDSMAKTGERFFRWRSYLPLLLLPLFVVSFIGAKDRTLGDVDDLLWELGCFVVSLFGLAIRIATIGTIASGTSGRNTLTQAARSLNTTGIYSLVRHPLYLGNYFVLLGISLFPRAWYLPVITSVLFLLYYERIVVCEEEFLEERFGDEFRNWAASTPAFLPRSFRLYVRPSVPFSWRTVFRREGSGLFSLGIAFWIMDMIEDLFAKRTLTFDPVWTVIMAGAFLLFIVLRYLRKAGFLVVSNR
jgi:protein-S-isoprenylcysteine O-methyltransferase Ste14